MNTYITLRNANIPYPDMALVKAISAKLGTPNGKTIGINGGFLRDAICLGHTRDTGDIDVAMSIADFLALKPQEDGQEDVRRHFALHEPHLLFMLHQINNGIFHENPTPVIAALKPEFMGHWGTTIPIGIKLSTTPINIWDLASDSDLAFSQIVSDGNEIWVTPAFVTDYRNRTMTMVNCVDHRAYERTLQRIKKFTAPGGRYEKWTPVIPEHFSQTFALTS